jgi:hypothetical protein
MPFLQQQLEYFSGFPVLLNLDAPAMLKNAVLDGRTSEIYKDKRGRNVEVSGLSRDYHLYILASRTTSAFSKEPIQWDAKALRATGSLCFRTYPSESIVPFTLLLDGTSPYKIPAQLRPEDIVSIEAASPRPGGFLLGLKFRHSNGDERNFFLTPDLFHYIRFDTPTELTDFHVEYIGIACGRNGNSDVFKRARAHEKVGEISGAIQRNFGNRDLFIFAYDPAYLLVGKAGAGVLITTDNALKAMVTGGANSLYEALEASLIAHFQPEYNDEFKTFPTYRPNWLQGKLNDLDGMVFGVDRIAVTLATDSSFNAEGAWSFGRFRSDARPPRLLHSFDVSVAR